VEPTLPLLDTPPLEPLLVLPPESRDTAVPDGDPPPPECDVPVLPPPPPPPPPLLVAPPPLLLLPPDDPCDCAAAGTLSSHIPTAKAIATPDHAETFRFMAHSLLRSTPATGLPPAALWIALVSAYFGRNARKIIVACHHASAIRVPFS
jgi:hypothetical protein